MYKLGRQGATTIPSLSEDLLFLFPNCKTHFGTNLCLCDEVIYLKSSNTVYFEKDLSKTVTVTKRKSQSVGITSCTTLYHNVGMYVHLKDDRRIGG